MHLGKGAGGGPMMSQNRRTRAAQALRRDHLKFSFAETQRPAPWPGARATLLVNTLSRKTPHPAGHCPFTAKLCEKPKRA